MGRVADRVMTVWVQGYLAHKEPPPPLGPYMYSACRPIYPFSGQGITNGPPGFDFFNKV